MPRMYHRTRPSSAPSFVAALVIALAPGAAFAQSYTLTETFGTFSSIASTGSPVTVNSQDDGSGSVSLPSAFMYFGTPVSTIYPCTNGYVSFDQPTADLSPDVFPSFSAPNGMAAAYWTDLVLGSGAIYTQQSGTTFIIEWSNVQIYQASDIISFQVRLNMQTGAIEMIYGPRTGSGSASGMGLEDATGSIGVGRACGTSCVFSDVPQGTVLHYEPTGATSSLDLSISANTSLPATVVPGTHYSVSVTVQNRGTLSASNFTMRLTADFFGSPVTIAENTVSTLGPGQSRTESLGFDVPSGLPSGGYSVIATVDATGSIAESDETNNDRPLGTITVGGGGQTISITTGSVPSATVGTLYGVQLQQSGGVSPTWRLASGSLPGGLTLSPSGRISGIPSAPGTSTFSVACSETGFTPGSASYQIEVTTGSGFRITSTMLSDATVGSPYTATMMATGGQAPYAFQAFAGVPSWMRVSGDGSISGTPTQTGHHEISVSVFDSSMTPQSVEGLVVIEVVAGGPLGMDSTQGDFISGVVGQNYDVEVRAHGGTTPYTFSIGTGSLPSGLALNGNRVQGQPSSAGNSTFELRVTDNAGGTASVSLRIEVVMLMPLSIEVPDHIVIRPNAVASFQLTARGGVPPYTWMAIGALPDGLILDGDTIRGTPTSTRTSSMLTLRVTDTQPTVIEKAVTVDVKTSGPTGPSNGNGGNQTRGRGGCAALTAEGASPLGLLMLVAFGLFVARRRKPQTPFLPDVSVVDLGSCPSRSSPDAPRSSEL